MTDFGYPPELTGVSFVYCDEVQPPDILPIALNRALYAESKYPLKMPFLPIDQLPEEWKDGRSVLMQHTDNQCMSVEAVCYYAADGFYTTFHLNKFTPTNFCPIALE